MSFIELLHRQYRLRFDSSKKAEWLLYYSHPGELGVKDDLIEYRVMGLSVPAGESFIFSRYYSMLRNLVNISGARFERSGERLYRCSVKGLNYFVETAEDIYILHEIFVEGDYNISLPEGQVVVVDIGMNVGFTSLYFAFRSEVKVVYGFEPFPKTFMQAQKNIGLNGSLASKVIANCYGLSDRDFTNELEYDYNEKGRMGVMGTARLNRQVNYERSKVEFRKAKDVVNDICSAHPDAHVILKIDCEGSEYSILPDLAAGGFAGNIKVLVIEWHEHGHAALSSLLKDKGFSMHIIRPDSDHVGMIYAFRS